MKYLLVLVFVLKTIICFGQDLPVIAPSSPDVSAIQKYGDVPINYHTGVPNISIPIYNIKTKAGVDIPITLKYHASGIKVDSKTGRTGLGWSLHTGGSISYNIAGIKDGLGTFPKPLGNEVSNTNFNYYTNQNDYFYAHSASSSLGELDIDGSPMSKSDTEPDIYQYNFLNRSGKFIINPTGNIHLIPHEAITINHSQNNTNILEFTITDEKGNKFYFMNRGSSKTERKHGHSLAIPVETVNWTLSKIETYLGEEIIFHYSNFTYSYTLAKEETDYHKYSIAGSTGCPNMTKKTNELYITQEEPVLDKITYTNGEINFSYSNDIKYPIAGSNSRLDSPGNPALRMIEVKNTNTIVSYYEFNYEYFGVSEVSQDEEDNYRLKLTSLKENGSDKVYNFNYNETENLPARFSKSQDYWGYYNGKQNTTMLPTTVFGNLVFSGADRSIDSQKVKANILEKITYPTGGYSKFTYESNTFYGTKDSLISKTISFPSALPSHYEENHPFTLEENAVGVNITTYNECQPANPNDPPGIPGEGDSCLISIIDQNNVTVFSETGSGNYDLTSLESGAYTLKYEASGNCLCKASISYKINQKSPLQNIKAGGLRILKIDNYDGNKTETTLYNYNQLNSNKSSGAVQGSPVYSYLQKNGIQSSSQTACEYLVRSYSSVYPIESIGQAVGYSTVTVFKNSSEFGKTTYEYSNNGEHNISNSPIVNMAVTPVVSHNNWEKGLLLSKKLYNKDNKLLYTELNTYDFDNQFAITSSDRIGTYDIATGLKIKKTKSEWHCGGTPSACISRAEFDWEYYGVKSAWVKLTEKTTIKYDTAGEKAITSTEKYFYDNPEHLQLTRTETTNSKGEVFSTKTYFPDDVISINDLNHDNITAHEMAAIDSLKNQKRIGTPLQIEMFRNTILQSTQRTNFYQTSDGLTLPRGIQTAKKDEILKDKIIFHSYYADGNIKEVSKKDGIHVYYIWGYNDSHPIAMIENFTDTQAINIQSLIDAAIIASNNDDDRTQDTTGQEGTLRAALEAIRSNSALNIAVMTAYTYDPLIGLTSTTDARGNTVYYNYDNANRLKEVKDANGNLITNYNYHYKGQ